MANLTGSSQAAGTARRHEIRLVEHRCHHRTNVEVASEEMPLQLTRSDPKQVRLPVAGAFSLTTPTTSVVQTQVWQAVNNVAIGTLRPTGAGKTESDFAGAVQTPVLRRPVDTGPHHSTVVPDVLQRRNA